MKPYYQDEFVTLYCGDNRILLPQIGQVCAVVTDPPYGIKEARGKNKSRGKIAVAKDFGYSDWDDKPPARWLIDLMRETSKYQIIFGGNYFELPPASCWLIWDKENGNNDFADCEIAWTNLQKAIRRFNYRWQGMLQGDMARKEIRTHATQKPLPVMRWAIGHLPPVETVLDPFAGSGTTLVACKQLGIKSIGIEINESFCADAVERLMQGSLGFESPSLVQYSHYEQTDNNGKPQWLIGMEDI